MPSDSSVSCQLSSVIAMTVLTTTATFAVIDAAVSVTTDWMPPTSFASRLWISPVRVAVKNRSGRLLQVRVQGVAQVLHHVLADDVVEVALTNPDQPRHDRQHDHQPDVQVELVVVAADDDVVDQQSEQQRVDEADEARGDDGHQDDDDLEPVRAEERRGSAGTCGRAARAGPVRSRPTAASCGPRRHRACRRRRPWRRSCDQDRDAGMTATRPWWSGARPAPRSRASAPRRSPPGSRRRPR